MRETGIVIQNGNPQEACNPNCLCADLKRKGEKENKLVEFFTHDQMVSSSQSWQFLFKVSLKVEQI